jgi:hypothetical protein
MDTLITGTFHDEAAANRAIDRLVDLGYLSDDISVIMSKETRSHFEKHAAPGESQGAHIAKGAAGGAAIGGTLGAIILGTLATTGAVGATVATGGIAGPFVVGPLAAALAGAGAGAAAGSGLGAIFGAATPHETVAKVQKDLDAGHIVVALHADVDDIAEAERILPRG